MPARSCALRSVHVECWWGPLVQWLRPIPLPGKNKPAGFANPWVGAVLKDSKRPNAAGVFLDFAMTPEGQEALNGEGGSASPLPNVKGTLDLAEYRILESKRFTQAVVDEWAKKFEQYFRK